MDNATGIGWFLLVLITPIGLMWLACLPMKGRIPLRGNAMRGNVR